MSKEFNFCPGSGSKELAAQPPTPQLSTVSAFFGKNVILGSFKLNPVMTASLKYLLYRKTKIPVGVKSNFQYFIFKETKNSRNPTKIFLLQFVGSGRPESQSTHRPILQCCP